MRIRTKVQIVVFFFLKKRPKRGKGGRTYSRVRLIFLEREREPLLSIFAGNPTVGIRREKKESCSTRRGLLVGTGFREFPQTPRGRGFSLLGFYSFFKSYVNV